ncbi:LysR family transcriptional regulator [Bacillus aquiflavi]|uniref:LysR family transcriptional regulator n=1 Tax=Bacillus aquiflavi TaxID=2672567 RepID=A0A6B3W2E3_9BACI|nr:LysR family transcriptional regulator [Bacillus aquiflavi]MBA4537867.1 LysR family transcriptional regulator [Bacillus aquiflavi]NEY82123.1 LysR family transcriptional regulator [Bacillus aquiflavi]
MDIEDLIIFRTVAIEESISKAAHKLTFAQSSITSKIKRMEAHFQSPLFHRHRYGVSLTAQGKILLSYTNQIVHLFKEAEKALICPKIPQGSLHIGSMETTAAVRLPVALSSFHEQYPEVELSLKTGPTEKLVKMVLNYELDGALVAGPIKHGELFQQKVIDEELVLVSKKDESLKNMKTSRLLVFRQGCSYRKKLEEWLFTENIMPEKIMEFGSLEAILGCVNAGMGISLLPKSVVEQVQRNYSFIYHEIPYQFGKVTTFFIQRKNNITTLAMEKFLETMKETFYKA